MNIAELPEYSDTSDEDYVPSGKREDIPSEIDSDGDSEEPLSDSENPDSRKNNRKRKANKTKKKVKNDCQKSGNSKENEHKMEESVDKKQKIDDIWADFMKDTGFRSKNRTDSKSLSNSKPKENSTIITQKISTPKKETSQKPLEKVKVTQIFEFAGEEVKVEKEVAVDSAEARLLENIPDDEAPKTSKGKRSGGLSGISGVLSQLGKKPKISTLEKSKLDWDKFKKEENIEEELQTFNKGKDGYLERQDFLQRADLRRFEIEKDIRTLERNKRFNSTL